MRDITGKDDCNRPTTNPALCTLSRALTVPPLLSSFAPDEFGDLTKAAVKKFTGKEEYQFGDITKTIGQALFGNKKVPPKDK